MAEEMSEREQVAAVSGYDLAADDVKDLRWLLAESEWRRSQAEASRRAWAEEAMRLDMAAEFAAVGTLDDSWPEQPGPNAPCACVSDEQRAALDPKWVGPGPVCAVHPPFQHAGGQPCHGCQSCLADALDDEDGSAGLPYGGDQ